MSTILNRQPQPWGALVCTAGLIAVDAGLALGAFLLAYWARFVLLATPGPGFRDCLATGLAVSSIAVVLLGMQGLYALDRTRTFAGLLHAIVSAVSTALVVAVVIANLVGEEPSSRLWLATAWTLAIAGLAVWRLAAQQLCARLWGALLPTSRTIVVGDARLAEQLARQLPSRQQLIGYVLDEGGQPAANGAVRLLGSIDQLERIVQAHAADELIVTLPAARRTQLRRLIARGRPVRVTVLPELGQLLPARVEFQRLGGQTCVALATATSVSWLKRAMDILVAGLALVALAPVLVAAAVAVKLDSPGPIFYRQQRVGKDGKRFAILKFRSMRPDAERLLAQLREQNEASGPLFKMRNDPRVTRVGRQLRRWSVDELPQLVNVLKGEMSLVGPRPPLPSEVEQYEEWQLGRLRAMPGLTGLWQVSGRSKVGFQDMVRLDLDYIRNWSLGLDLSILFRTIPAVLTNRGAY